ncbi:MAG: hypothetical protein ACOCVG_04710, partial [Verrucomicrobiota bacterium]
MKPPAESTPETETQPAASEDRWLGLLIYGLALVGLLPLLIWLGRTVFHQEQSHHALLVLVFSGVMLAIERRGRWRPVLQLNHSATASLMAGLGLLAAAGFLNLGLLALLALAVLLYSLIVFIFGESASRMAAALAAALGAYLLAVLILPISDWTLRL